MRSIDGSFAFLVSSSKLNPHVSFIFKTRGEDTFLQYTTISTSKIYSIEDFKTSTPVIVLESIKKKKHFDKYGQIFLGNFTGVKNVLSDNEILVFSSNVIPGQWKIFTRVVNQRHKEYYIMRLE